MGDILRCKRIPRRWPVIAARLWRRPPIPVDPMVAMDLEIREPRVAAGSPRVFKVLRGPNTKTSAASVPFRIGHAYQLPEPTATRLPGVYPCSRNHS